jgi:hypothetical protein
MPGTTQKNAKKVRKLMKNLSPAEINEYGPDKYDKERNALAAIAQHFGYKFDNLYNQLDRFEKAVDDHYNDTLILSDEQLASKERTIKSIQKEIYDLQNFNPNQMLTFANHEPRVKEYLVQRNIRLKPIKDAIKAHKEKVKELGFTEIRESKRAEFEKLDIIRRSTKNERNNLILSAFIAMHSDPSNFSDREKTGEMENMKAASNFANTLLGVDTKNAHPTNLADKVYFRNLTMNVATLKENSVAYDNILAILGTLKSYNSVHEVPGVMRFEEVKGYNPNDVYNTIDLHFQTIFGKDNVKIDRKNKLVHINNIGFIASNAAKDKNSEQYKRNLDIQGQSIMQQRSELTTNILDAIKQVMINLTSDTFSLFAYLSSTPLSFNSELHQVYNKKGKPIYDGVNRFLFPALFIAQPAVQELSRRTIANNRFGDKRFGTYVMREVKGDYSRDLIDALTMYNMPDKESFIGFTGRLSTTYVLEDTIDPFTGKEYDLYEIDYMQEEVRLMYKDAYEELMEHEIGEPLRNVDIKVLNAYLEYLGFKTIDSLPQTLDVLVKNIADNKIGVGELPSEDIPYYINQLSILNYYELVDRAAADVRSLMGIFNTDKLGAGPTSAVTNKWFDNTVKFETNFGAFEEHLRNRVFKGDYETYSRTIKEIKGILFSLPSLSSKISYAEEMFDKYDYNSKGASLKTADGESVTHAVFGDMFANNKPDYLKSKYPYLAAQAIWTNLLSTKIFTESMFSEDPRMKATINNLLARLDSIKDSRLIFHTSANKEEMLRHHFVSEKPTVIVSPSVSTGVSFDHDKSRFQVIAKIPYPSLASQKNKLRQKTYPEWYAYRTIAGIIQACGRSIRSHTDYADTIIIDSCFGDILKYSSHFFPNWVLESIIHLDKK